MLAQAHFCHSVLTKYSPSASTIWPVSCPFSGPNFLFSISTLAQSSSSPASCVGATDKTGGRGPRKESIPRCPSPSSHCNSWDQSGLPHLPDLCIYCFFCLWKSSQLCLRPVHETRSRFSSELGLSFSSLFFLHFVQSYTLALELILFIYSNILKYQHAS